MGKKRKNYYVDKSSSKKSKTLHYAKLHVGVSGFIISHDKGKAQPCTKNTFQLLNHYADLFYGNYGASCSGRSGEVDDVQIKSKNTAELQAYPESDDDIDAALAKEVESLQNSVKSTDQKMFRFYRLKSGCNNMIFIKANGIKPSILLYKIVSDLVANSSNIFATPFILRLHPADVTCKAHLSDIKTLAESYISKGLDALWEEIIDKEKEHVNKEFGIVFRQRNNDHLSKTDVTSVIVCAVRDSSSNWVFNSKSTKFFLIIEVIQVVCGMGVTYDYSNFKKLNIHELRLSKIQNVDNKDSTHSPNKEECEKSQFIEKKILSNSGTISSANVSLQVKSEAVQDEIEVLDKKNYCRIDEDAATVDIATSEGYEEVSLKEDEKCMPSTYKSSVIDTTKNLTILDEKTSSNQNLEFANNQSDEKDFCGSSNCIVIPKTEETSIGSGCTSYTKDKKCLSNLVVEITSDKD